MSNDFFPNFSVSFDVQASEEAKEFFDKMRNESSKALQEAIEARIHEMFSEHIGISGKDKEVYSEAYMQILEVFSIGYKCGWNDLRNVVTTKQ